MAGLFPNNSSASDTRDTGAGLDFSDIFVRFNPAKVIGVPASVPGPGSIAASQLAASAAHDNLGAGGVDASRLAPGAAAANLGAGAITRTLLARADQLSQVGWFSVRDWGALGDNVTDDSAAILACHGAAAAVGGTVWYPPGSYRYGSGIPITITTEGVMSSNAIVNSLGTNTIDCFVVRTGNTAAILFLPNVGGFSRGSGLVVMSNVAVTYQQIISGCRAGVEFRLDLNAGAGGVLDNTINVNWIPSCSQTAVLVNYPNGMGILQGNIVNVNFVDLCKRALWFQAGTVPLNGGVATQPLNQAGNQFNLYAVDGGAAQGVIGSKAVDNGGLTLIGVYVDMSLFFGNFSGSPVISWGGGYNNEAIIQGSPGGGGDYPFGSFLMGSVSAGYTGNVTRCKQASEGGNFPISAGTTPNSRATFNGGKSPLSNRIVISMVLPTALGQASLQKFYAYHDFVSGDTNLVSAKIIGGNFFVSAYDHSAGIPSVDTSSIVPGEIVIVVTSLTGAAAGTTIICSLTVGI